MTPYQLKKSILLKGVKGELVEQIDAEGTGKEVLLRSDEIRQRIIKQDKLKAKEIKPIDDKTELYFDIPKNWEWERFGNLVINYDSKRKPVAKEQRKTENGTYDYYGATGAIDKVDEYIFDGEYLMIGEDGGNFFVDRDNSFVANGQFWANNHVHVVKPALCDIYYLKYYLDCLNLPGLGLINGIAVPKLNQENLNSIVVPVPPLEEQHRIVAKIEELLPFVDRYAVSYEKLEQFNTKFPEDMKKSILQYAIQGKLVEQRPEEGTAEDLYKAIQEEKKQYKIKTIETNPMEEPPFDIPDSWKWIQLQDIVKKTIKRGKSPKYTENSNIQVFAQKCNVKTGGINMELAQYLDLNAAEKYSDEEYMVNGDIIINSTGGGTMGRVGIFHDTDRLNNMKIVPDGHVTIIRACDMVDYKYLYYFIKHNQKYLETQGEGSTNQTELKPITIASLALPLPPLEEQHRIVAKIEELLPYCDRLVK